MHTIHFHSTSSTLNSEASDIHLSISLQSEAHQKNAHLHSEVLVFMVGINLEAVNGLQQLGLLVQQLLQNLLLFVLW